MSLDKIARLVAIAWRVLDLVHRILEFYRKF